MEFIKQNQTMIFRVLGGLMLLVAFVIHFWTVPKEVLSENEIAAANIARMEAHTNARGNKKTTQQDKSKFLDKIKSQQAKQLEYLTILAMVLGVGFLGYSFLKKPEEKF
jgi:beta-lactamase regulating signal transducer with metallopeptidase domain